MINLLTLIFKNIIDIILPARCPQTGEIVSESGALSPRAWAELQFIAPPYCACCGTPFTIPDISITNKNELLCGKCLENEKPYTKLRSVLAYDDYSRSLILGFKHGDKTHLTTTFAPLLKSYGHEALENADALIPVPLHWRRLLYRRYNQSAILSHAISKICQTPTWADALIRIKHTAPQGHKNAKSRFENVHNVFKISPKYIDKIKGKNLVIIDDVLTTGATAEECTKTLLNAGANNVNVLTLAMIVRTD